jgi:putative transposase
MVVLMYVRFPLSLRNVEDLLFERGIDLCHETVRFWWNRLDRRCQSDANRSPLSRLRPTSEFLSRSKVLPLSQSS